MDVLAKRTRMVETQIAARGVKNPRVLDAMRSVPRHLFVPESARHEAYDDRPQSIGEGQTISQPYMVAIMTETLDPRPDDRVLEIGTGSGYQTAILAELVRQVISIERHGPLAARARALLGELGLTNVRITVGDGTHGSAADAPFDRILVTAGAPAVPATLTAQLGDGGRLVIPVGPPGYQVLTVIDYRNGTFTEKRGEACTFVPLIGSYGWREPS
jgi:protein-L-isoaspartate(D-aspartate) O-methyltransferase